MEQTENKLRNTTTVLRATQQTEQKLTEEAQILIQTLKISIADGDKLHENIMQSHNLELKRRKQTRDFQEDANEMLNKSLSLLTDLSSKSKQYLKNFSVVYKDDNTQEDR